MSDHLRYDAATSTVYETDGGADAEEWPVIRLAELHALGFFHKDDLAGVSELGAKFGLGKTTIVGWARRRASNKMPEPVTELLAGPIYSRHQVESWWKAWRPRKGRRAGSLDAA